MSISYNSNTFTLATTETFNGELEKKDIPRETRAIYLGHYFNQEIKVNILPNTLNKIVFGHRYNKEIKKGVLPKSITYLRLGCSYSYKIDIGVLPKKLRHLTISNYKYAPDITVYPPYLKIFEISNVMSDILDNLPQTLETLIISGVKNTVNNLPSKLRKIVWKGGTYPEKYFPKLPFGCIIIDK